MALSVKVKDRSLRCGVNISLSLMVKAVSTEVMYRIIQVGNC